MPAQFFRRLSLQFCLACRKVKNVSSVRAYFNQTGVRPTAAASG